MTDFDLSVLRDRAETGDVDAVGDLDQLRRLSELGNATATDQLTELTAE